MVEVGLAYGRSALAIGEALLAVDARRPLHVIIDPLQATEWSNVGWRMLRSAGLSTRSHGSTSSLRQWRFRGSSRKGSPPMRSSTAATGSHEVFVDLYFLRKIVRPGGLIVLDDHSVDLGAHRGTLLRGEHGLAGRPGAFDRGTVDQETGRACPGAAPARTSVRTARHSSASSRSEVARAASGPCSALEHEGDRSPGTPLSRTPVRTSLGWKMPSRSLPGSPGK